MDDLDLDVLDGKIETERQWLVSTLRRIADRVEALPCEDVIEPLTMMSTNAESLVHTAERALRVSLGSPPVRAS